MNSLGGRALVIGSDTRSFLSVVRSLGRAGVEVHVAGCPANAPALRSRYIHRAHAVPPSAVPDFLRTESFDLVIPCDDFAILPLELRRDELTNSRIAMLDEEAFRIASDKQQTYELARELEISLPRQAYAGSVEEIAPLAREFGWPLVLKPASSVTAADPGSRNAVRKAWDMAEVRAMARPPLLVQENFIGIGVGVEVLCREGEVLVAFQHERVHEPMGGGGSTYRKSVPLSPHLLDAARRLMRAMRYTGVGMVEFKVNPKTQAWILIEINGRFWGSLPLSIAAGADFPRYLYEMLVHGRRDFPQQYRTGVYARNWMLDMRWLARNLLTDRSNPALMSRPLAQVLREPLNFPREHSDTFTADDPAPGWAEVVQTVGQVMRPLFRQIPPVRARMAARAAAAACDARRVLFVCKGNICRSPFAAAFLGTLALPGVEVESAGYYQKQGRPSPAAAITAARDFGVDLSTHRSQILNREHIHRADVIFIFEPDQEREILGWFPEAAKKLHYLGGIAIRDPWGRDAEEFTRVYHEIRQAVISSFRQAPLTRRHRDTETQRRLLIQFLSVSVPLCQHLFHFGL